MSELDSQVQSSQLIPLEEAGVIRHLEQDIANGKHWYIALLEAIGMWNAAEESHNGCHYCYLVAGEAFDWLLLAERLCQAVDGLLPGNEKATLLFSGKPPLNLTIPEFKRFIGSTKFGQYLNYFYGITVEEALVLAVQDEIRKERRLSGDNRELDTESEAYQRIYGTTKATLLKCFRQEKDYPQQRSISLSELKEFTYWLFKYRFKQCDKARVASDTEKGLSHLEKSGFNRPLATDEMPRI